MRNFFYASFIFLVQMAGAASWYVDNAATGSRNGTSWANAWTNLASVTGISAGDTVYISGGSTTKTYYLWGGSFREWVPANYGSGTAGNRITYKIGQEAGHNGVAIFDGTNAPSAQGGGRFKVQGWKHGTISGDYNGGNNIIVTNVESGSLLGDYASDVTVDHVTYYSGVRFNSATNIELSFCYIKPLTNAPDYCVFWGVYPSDENSTAFTNNVIRNCDLVAPVSETTPAWGTDMIQGGKNSLVISNRFSTYTIPLNTEWQHTDGWQNLGNSYCRVEANDFLNIANYAIYWECIGVSATNVWVINNVFRHTLTASASGSSIGVVIGPQGTSGKLFKNIIVANNSFADWYGRLAIGMGQLTTTNTWEDSFVINNLMVNCVPLQFFNSSPSVANTVTNGISILHNKAQAGADGNTTFTPGQLFTPGGGATIGFVDYTKLSAANDLHLLSSDTAAIDLGYDLSAYFTTDADGNTRSGTWDLGAYEYVTPLSTYRGFQFGSGVQLIGPGRLTQ